MPYQFYIQSIMDSNIINVISQWNFSCRIEEAAKGERRHSNVKHRSTSITKLIAVQNMQCERYMLSQSRTLTGLFGHPVTSKPHASSKLGWKKGNICLSWHSNRIRQILEPKENFTSWIMAWVLHGQRMNFHLEIDVDSKLRVSTQTVQISYGILNAWVDTTQGILPQQYGHMSSRNILRCTGANNHRLCWKILAKNSGCKLN